MNGYPTIFGNLCDLLLLPFIACGTPRAAAPFSSSSPAFMRQQECRLLCEACLDFFQASNMCREDGVRDSLSYQYRLVPLVTHLSSSYLLIFPDFRETGCQ